MRLIFVFKACRAEKEREFGWTKQTGYTLLHALADGVSIDARNAL